VVSTPAKEYFRTSCAFELSTFPYSLLLVFHWTLSIHPSTLSFSYWKWPSPMKPSQPSTKYTSLCTGLGESQSEDLDQALCLKMRPPRERESLVDSLTVIPLQFAGGRPHFSFKPHCDIIKLVFFPFEISPLFLSSSLPNILIASINHRSALLGLRPSLGQVARRSRASPQAAGPAVLAAGSLRGQAKSVKKQVACTSPTPETSNPPFLTYSATFSAPLMN
jgi:hypothetical protein